MEQVKQKYVNFLRQMTKSFCDKNNYRYSEKIFDFFMLCGELNENCFNSLFSNRNIINMLSNILENQIIDIQKIEKLKCTLENIRDLYKDIKQLEGFNYEIVYNKNNKKIEFVEKI
jgi:hypothetical protein